MRTGLRGAAVGTVVLALAAVACRQLLDIGPDPRTDFADSGSEAGVDAGASCGVTYANAGCEACVEAQCCSAASACAADDTCSGLQSCLAACGADGGADPTCRAQCAASNQIGANAAADQLAACIAGSCAQPCGVRCGGSTFLNVADASAACAACIAADLCQVGTTCATDTECQAVFGCLRTPYDPNTGSSCFSQHDAGVDAAAAVINGLTHQCLTACATDNQWWCLGSAVPPPWTATTDVSVSLYLLSALGVDGGVVQDASVTLCDPYQPPCSAIASGTTGASGQVTLPIPAQPTGIGWSGYLQIRGAGLAPELYYWGYSVGGPAQSWSVPVVMQSLDAGPSTSATVVATVTDCLSLPASGVDFSIAPDASQLSATLDGITVAIFTNVPTDAGGVTITATPHALGRPSSVVPVFVQPGVVTAVLLPVNQ